MYAGCVQNATGRLAEPSRGDGGRWTAGGRGAGSPLPASFRERVWLETARLNHARYVSVPRLATAVTNASKSAREFCR